ncbi:hypothetical protein CsSME_00004201 [Camellia sinensis var. sinensis]
MAVSSYARVFPSFQCRSDPDFSGIPRPENQSSGRFSRLGESRGLFEASGLSSLIFRFPPNFVRQLSIKARRNCSNIGVAQVVAASWSNNQSASGFSSAAALSPVEISTGDEEEAVVAVDNVCCNDTNVQIDGLIDEKPYSFLSSDGSIAVHAGTFLYIYMSRIYICISLILILILIFCLFDLLIVNCDGSFR